MQSKTLAHYFTDIDGVNNGKHFPVNYHHLSMEKLMNDENEWDHRISAGVKEGPANCIDEVAASRKKMKRHKAPGFSGLVADMIQATGILELSRYWI